MNEYNTSTSLNIQDLRANALGNMTSIPRTKAIFLLLLSDYPDKLLDFQRLLEKENEKHIIRYIAAICLGKTNSTEAREILVKNIGIPNEEVLTGIFEALGRIGDKQSLKAILKVKDRVTGFSASQAKFALTIISYRLGLQGNDLRIPTDDEYHQVPPNAQQIQVARPEDSELRTCLNSIKGESYGIDLATNPAFQVHYDRGVGIVLFNQSVINLGNLRRLLKRKMLLGVFADRFEESRLYSIAYVIFSSPSHDKSSTNILVTRPNGKLVFGGKALMDGNNVKFFIRSISQKGVFPLLIEGMIQDNVLHITEARFSTILQDKNQPLISDN